jgi:putative ABC transport system permease protein
LRLIQLTNAGSLPRAGEIGIDLRVLLSTVLAALFTGMLFGMAPMFSVAVKNLQDSLKDTAGSLTANTGAQGFRKLLVAGELAMALVLLIGCGLMIRGFWKLQEVRTGINAESVITMKIALPGMNYAKGEQTDQFWRGLDGKITSLPGVTSAAIGSGLPPIRPPDMNDTKIEGFVHQPGGPIENVDYYNVVSMDFFKTLGIRLMDGRLFDERDVKGSPDVAIVNQTMARTFWGNETPLGHRIQPGMNGPMCTIIGVVEDVKNAGLDKPTGTEIFLPYAQQQGSGNRAASVFLRSRGDPTSLANAVRSAVRSIDPMIPVTNVQTVEQVLASARSRPRFLTLLLVLFSSVALVIASVGIYAVISFSVARRSKEFALRMALGAQQKDVLGLVMKQGAALALFGIAGGLLGAFALTRLMASLLFGVRPTDALTFVSISALLAAVALCASFIPAQRATRVDPMQALRHE